MLFYEESKYMIITWDVSATTFTIGSLKDRYTSIYQRY